MQNKINIRDIIDLLEYKVQFNICTDEEYGFYLDYRRCGKKVFTYEENKYIVRKLIRDCETYYEEGDYI